MTSEPKRPRGRPRTDPSGPQKPASVQLTPTERQYLTTTYGSVNAGLRALVAQAMTAANHQPAR